MHDALVSGGSRPVGARLRGTDTADLSAPAWKPYRELLAAVPADRVTACVVGVVWTLIANETGRAGVALTFTTGLDDSSLPGAITGTDLRTACGWVTSWRPYEAAVGTAALNSVFNTPEHVQAMTGRPLQDFVVEGGTVFEQVSRRFAGGRVAVIGNFPVLGKLAETCQVTVLERLPDAGDVPDPAAEYVLAEQDCVCITGTAVTNKTLPRLLELSRSAYVALIGPSVPLSPVWLDYGVDLLAGSVVTDAAGVRHCVQEGAHRRAFREGLSTVCIAAADVTGR